MLLPAPWLLAAGLVIGLLVLLPARRLHDGGLSRGVITGYALTLWLLGLALVWRPIGARFIVPILLIAYIAPFVAGPDRVARLGRIERGRGGRAGGGGGRGSSGGSGPAKPPMKNVTPVEEPEPETPPAGRP
jgi:hypothetical protein